MIQRNEIGLIVPSHGILEHGIRFQLHSVQHYKNDFEKINGFHSGNAILDELLQKEAHNHKECTTYLFYLNDELVAYCSLCASSLFIDEQVDEKIVPIMHPAIEFRYFAVIQKYWGKEFEGTPTKISSYIFEQCIVYAFQIAQSILGVEYFVLHAKNDHRVRAFYKKHGFQEFPEKMRPLTDDRFEKCIPAFIKLPSTNPSIEEIDFTK